MNAPLNAALSASMSAHMNEHNSGHRQAAVALHALDRADRELVLAELGEADRQILRAYLAELDSLGFEPADSAAAAATLACTQPEADALDAASGADLHRLLQDEPAALVAQVLSLHSWRWRAGYLALQTASRREQLRAAAPTGPLAPARAAFLENAVRARLTAQLAAAAPATLDSLAAPRTRGGRLSSLRRMVKLAWTR